MAEVLESFDFTQQREDIDRSHKYPWDLWLDGRIWMITKGEDFALEDMVMDRTLRNGAYKKKAKLTMKHPAPGVIVFQATAAGPSSSSKVQPMPVPTMEANDIGTPSRKSRIVRPSVREFLGA